MGSRHLLKVALNAATAIQDLHAHVVEPHEMQEEISRVNEGLELLALLERVKEMCGSQDKIEYRLIDSEYWLVRDSLFVERIKPGQLGYEEVEPVVRRELASDLWKIIKMGYRIKEVLGKFIADPNHLQYRRKEEKNQCVDFFLGLHVRMENPR